MIAIEPTNARQSQKHLILAKPIAQNTHQIHDKKSQGILHTDVNPKEAVAVLQKGKEMGNGVKSPGHELPLER